MDFQLDRRGFDSAPGHHASPFGLRVARPRLCSKGEACPAKPSAARAKTDWRAKGTALSVIFKCQTATPSLRAKRGNPHCFHGRQSGLLRRGACHRAALRADPLAPRNDGGESVTQHSRGTKRARVMHQRRPLQNRRAQGMPGAGRTREPCVQRKCTLRTQATTGQPQHPAFPAQWLYGLYAFSPVSGLVSHRRLRDHHLASLIPASGDQDAAISSYALAALVSCAMTSIASRCQRP